VWVRVAEHGGLIYLDLCNSAWEVIEISPGRFSSTAESDRRSAFDFDGSIARTIRSKSPTVRPTTPAAASRSRSACSQSSQWAARRWKGLGFSLRGTKAATLNPGVFGQHAKACKAAKVEHFPIYTFHHTCLTRWAPFMDPWTLAYLAGHRDTKRYVHPQEFSTRAAMEKARVALSGHNSGRSPIASADSQIAN
jgi:integrase